MKYIQQFGIVLAVAFIGEVLKCIIPLPIPASIYGLILMLFVLKTKIIPLNKVKEVGGFLIEIMPVMFIPVSVGLMVSWSAVKDIWMPIMFTIAVTTIIVMAVTGRVTQYVIRTENRRKK